MENGNKKKFSMKKKNKSRNGKVIEMNYIRNRQDNKFLAFEWY